MNTFLLNLFLLSLVGVQQTFTPCEWRKIPKQASYYSATKMDSLYIVVGDSGIIETSKECEEWTCRSSGVSVPLRGIAHSENKLVAVGDSGTVLISADADKWNKYLIDSSFSLKGIVWAESLFVAIGDSGRILLSKNGEQWKVYKYADKSFQDISWNGKYLNIINNSRLPHLQLYKIISSDSIQYKSDSSLSPVISHGPLKNSIASKGSLNVYLSLEQLSASASYIYPLQCLIEIGNETVWVPRNLLKIVYVDSEFIAVGGNRTIFTSIDAKIWKLRSTANPTLKGIVWNGQDFYSVGDFGWITKSKNGQTWERQKSNTIKNLKSINWNKREFVVVGESDILSSPDGTNWTIRYSDTSVSLSTVTWTGTEWVAAGNGIVTSPDGINWTKRNNVKGINAITYKWGKLIAVGSAIMTSVNDSDWNVIPWSNVQWNANYQYFYDIACSDSQVVAVGIAETPNRPNTPYEAKITSSDGNLWTGITQMSDEELRGVIYANDKWITVGSEYCFYDGKYNGLELASGLNRLYDVSCSDSLAVAVGMNGIVCVQHFSSQSVKSKSDTKLISSISLSFKSHNHFDITISDIKPSTLFVRIITAQGREVFCSGNAKTNGKQTYSFPVPNLSNGIYLIDLQYDRHHIYKKYLMHY